MIDLLATIVLCFSCLFLGFVVGLKIGVHDGEIMGAWYCKMRFVKKNRKNMCDLWEHTWLMRHFGGEW